jgi:hypothetical protein
MAQTQAHDGVERLRHPRPASPHAYLENRIKNGLKAEISLTATVIRETGGGRRKGLSYTSEIPTRFLFGPIAKPTFCRHYTLFVLQLARAENAREFLKCRTSP